MAAFLKQQMNNPARKHHRSEYPEPGEARE